MRRYYKKNIIKKDRNVTIRFDQATYDRIEAAARATDLSVSEYIRRMVIKGKVTVRQEIVAEVPMLKKLIAEFGKIGSNLNQIAHHYNGGGVRSREMYERTQRAISELYAMKYEVERMASKEAYGLLRAQGGPIPPDGDDTWYEPGVRGALMQFVYWLMAKSQMGDLIACAHCRNAFEEMEMLDRAFDAIIARTPDYTMPNWQALKAQMPDWETVREQYRKV